MLKCSCNLLKMNFHGHCASFDMSCFVSFCDSFCDSFCCCCCFVSPGVAEAFVCLWKRPHMLARVNSSTVPKLVSYVLDLLDTDRLPQGAGETGVVRRGRARTL